MPFLPTIISNSVSIRKSHSNDRICDPVMTPENAVPMWLPYAPGFVDLTYPCISGCCVVNFPLHPEYGCRNSIGMAA